MNTDAAPTSLQFEKLPLADVVLRATLMPPIPMSLKIVNDLAQELKADFPTVRDLERMEVAPGVENRVEIGQGLHGAAYGNGANGVTVAVQQQLVTARWCKQTVSIAPDYPRFPVMKSSLLRALEALQHVCGKHPVNVLVVNMSYTNIITGNDPPDVRRYLAPCAHVAIAKGASTISKIEAAWRGERDIDLRFIADAATAWTGDEQRPAYRLKTIAGMFTGADADAVTCLNLVHEKLQGFFKDLISDDAKNEWGLR